MSTPVKNIDALSGLANNPALSPKLLHSHLFDGSLALPADSALSGSGTFYYGYWTGSDGLGFASSNVNNVYDTETLGSWNRATIIIATGSSPSGDVNFNDYRDIAPVWTYSFAPNDMPGGKGYKAVVTQEKRTRPEWDSLSYPQMWLHEVARLDWATKQLPALCYSYQIKIPSNLESIMDGRAPYPEWFETFFIKAHGTDNNQTDSRLSINLYRDATTRAMKWRVGFDLFIEDMAGTAIGSMALWSLFSGDNTVIAGDVYEVNLYFKPPASKDDMTGEVQVLIINQSKNTVAMADALTGVTMMGYRNHNFGRISWGGVYTGGWPDIGKIVVEYGNFKIYRRLAGLLPFIAPKTIQDFVKFHAPLTSSLALSSGSGNATATGFTPSYNDDGLLISPGDVLTYPGSGNYSNQTGTWLIRITKDDWSTGNGVAFGKTGVGIMLSSSNSGVYASDGSDTVYGPAGTPQGTMVIGVRFSGAKFQCFSNAQFGDVNNNFTAASFVFTTIAIMQNCAGRSRNASIYSRWLSDAEIQKITADLLAA